MERYTGTVERIGDADVNPLIEWALAIPFEDWPQQHPVNGAIRPAMVKDLEWHGFGDVVRPVVDEAMKHFPGCSSANWLLTVVMPDQGIDEHTDSQAENWRVRVHAPLTTNDESRFRVGGAEHHMEVGSIYLVNTEVPHSVANDGATPRIHFMFDVIEQ